MSPRFGFLFIIFVCLNSCLLSLVGGQEAQTPTKGGLNWETRDAEVTLGAPDKEVAAHYVFQNQSNAPVTILALSTSCQCVRANADKKIYAPQEKGEITVTLTRAANQSAVSKGTVMVETDFTASPRAVLTLIVKKSDAPAGLLEPTSLTWDAGEARRPKSIKLVVLKSNSPVKDVSVTCTDPKIISAQAKPMQAGKEYEITAVPASGVEGTVQAKLIIHVDYVNGQASSIISVMTIN